MNYLRFSLCLSVSIALSLSSYSTVFAAVPADKFNLKNWKLTLPTDLDTDGKVDEVSVMELQKYSHPDFFYIDEHGFLVFTAPNLATTSTNSSNVRSELRQMYRGYNTKIGTHDPKNNFALKSHRRAKRFADIGGQLEATLRVLNVSQYAEQPDKRPAYSVVIGQVHSIKDKKAIKKDKGFGYGNEPIKIFYKKWPEHKTGSVFWTYERNLDSGNPDRTDLVYPVWGNTWDNSEDPGENGIALGQLFNYNINIYESTAYLTFRTTDASRTVKYEINLANNIDANGAVDAKDNPQGYAQDSFYFKIGAYNQCGAKNGSSAGFPACLGAGVDNWALDKANGDYASVAFQRILLTRAVKR